MCRVADDGAFTTVVCLIVTRMPRLISVIGLRRSGLHAVVNWLIGLHPGRVRLVNDQPPSHPF
jgi:hypothetical protein